MYPRTNPVSAGQADSFKSLRDKKLFTKKPVVTKYIKVEFINNIIYRVGYVASAIPFGLSIFAQPR